MKRAVLLAVVLALSCGVSFAGGPTTTATGGAVTLTAIIPSYIGFTSPNIQSITFDYTIDGLALAMGLPVTKLAGTNPSWTLLYNLSGKPTITVCAYATALTGSGTNSIPASSVYGAPNGGATLQFNGSGCGQTGNAIVMDTINGATFNTGKTEAFTGFFLQTPNGAVVPPDTYTGTLNIIAQAQ